nr:hypothetical protein [Tanacetum cinerariifolium]
MEASSSKIRKVKKRMDEIGQDLGDEMQFSNLVEHRVTKLEDKDQEKAEMEKMKKHLGTLETNYSLVLSDRDEWKKAFYNLQAWVSERLRRGALDARPDIGDDGPASFRESKPPKMSGSPSSSQIMPPKMMKRKAVKKMVKKWIAKATEEYEKTKVNPSNASGSGVTNTGGSMNVKGCTHKTFMNGKAHPFNGTEGVVGLRRWIKKVEQVFEICKCAEEDKGDDIEAYNNRFHELVLMCPDLMLNEKKKIERYMKVFPERIKGNNTSLRPTTLHEAINLARELVEQAVQGKAARVNESNKKKWEEHHKNHPNNKNNPNNRNHNRNYNNQHHQQNRRQETARAYAAAPTEGKAYAGTLPKCNRCNLHHNGQCPLKCRREGASRTRELVRELTWWLKTHSRIRMWSRVRFLLNDHYASVLFDSGAQRSFVSIEFSLFINSSPVALNTSYEVELANRKIVSTNTVLRGCTLALFSHMFKIDLVPTRLGGFDVIVGMDWLSYHRGVIVCYEKIVHIPLPNGEILKIHDDLTGLPPVREIEFKYVTL